MTERGTHESYPWRANANSRLGANRIESIAGEEPLRNLPGDEAERGAEADSSADVAGALGALAEDGGNGALHDQGGEGEEEDDGDILRDSIGLPSELLLLFEFATSFGFKFRASRYITRLNQTSD